VFKTDPICLVYKRKTTVWSACANIGVLLGIASVKTKNNLQSVCLRNKCRLEFIRICVHRD